MRRIFAIASLFISTAIAQSCNTIAPVASPAFASGYSGHVLLNGLKNPRGIIFDTKDNLLIIEQGGGGVRRVTFKDNGGTDICVNSSAQIIKDNTLNHGIALSLDGRTLYVSSLPYLFSYPYDPVTGSVGTKKILVNNMTNGGYHLTRTLLVSKTVPDTLIMQRGSDGNLDDGAADVRNGRSLARIFSMSALNASTAPVDFSTSGTLLGSGLRNSVGWAEHPITGGIFSVENSADDIIRSGVDVHNTNPGEEMNFHGILNDTKSAQRGADYGYPNCFAAWDTSILPNNASLKVGSHFAIHDLNQTNSDALCAAKMGPRLTFPSHTAPLDMKFKKDGSAAFISFHGSWDRTPPDGYRLSRIAFGKDGQPVEGSTSQNATVNVMMNQNNSVCPGSCFRPTALAFDSKDRLFMSSDQTNEIWIIGGT